MTKPSSGGAITTYIWKKFLVNWIRGTEGYFFNDLINNQRLKKKNVKKYTDMSNTQGNWNTEFKDMI